MDAKRRLLLRQGKQRRNGPGIEELRLDGLTADTCQEYTLPGALSAYSPAITDFSVKVQTDTKVWQGRPQFY